MARLRSFPSSTSGTLLAEPPSAKITEIDWADDDDGEAEPDSSEDSDDARYGNEKDVPTLDELVTSTAEDVMRQAEEDGMDPRLELILDFIIWTMPFAFLFLALDIMIQQQYSQKPSFSGELRKLAGSVPVLAVLIFYTFRPSPPRALVVKALLFALSIASGAAFLWTLERANWEAAMQRVPPLGTIWIYTIVRLDLIPACIGLAIIAVFVKWADLKLWAA